jgi:hypothetical protein
MHDMLTGETTLETKNANQSAGVGTCACPFLTPDLHYLVFSSSDDEYVPGDTNFEWDVFIKDRWAGTYERVTVDSDEMQGPAVGGDPSPTSLSADGRFVVFTTRWVFDPADTNPGHDLYLRDREAGTTTWISAGSPGDITDTWESYFGKLTADERVVVFTSMSKNIVAGKSTLSFDIVARHLLHDVTRLVEKGWDGSEPNGSTDHLSCTPGGRTVACSSWASNLVPNDLYPWKDVFVFELSPWTDIGSGLSGATGVPLLAGAGQLKPGEGSEIDLTGAAPGAPSALFVAFDPGAAPFKGGTLVPVPPVLLLLGLTSPTGELSLAFTWPPGIPALVHFDLQFAVLDAGGPHGFALSNALDVLTP